jgi:hypothetical protein
LEAILLALDELTALVVELASDDVYRTPARRLAQLELAITDGRTRLRKLVLEENPLTGEADRVSGIRQAHNDIRKSEAQIHTLVEQLPHNMSKRTRFSEKFQAAKSDAASAVIEQRHQARAALLTEFKSALEGLVLHSNRVITIHLKPDLDGCRISYILNVNGVHAARVSNSDGKAQFINSNAFLRLR